MATTANYAFSSDGEYFAHCGNDGKLKIWDTNTGRLKQEYVSNFHLSSPCCILEWLYISSRTTNTSVNHVLLYFISLLMLNFFILLYIHLVYYIKIKILLNMNYLLNLIAHHECL